MTNFTLETTIEQDIKDAGVDKFPRVTPQHIEACIKSEHFFTADQGVAASDVPGMTGRF